MNTKQWLSAQTLTLPLIALMALTRFHHFGDTFSLPDASLAVFFLAGLGFAKRWWLLGFLMLEAAVIDYVAITHFNVSAYCISSAYLFLIPTYAVMWFAGSYCVAFKALTARNMIMSIAIAMVATTMAFLISNGSFYLLSGRFADLSVAQYMSSIAHYYLPYTSAALCYAAIGLAASNAIKALPVWTEHHKTV